MIVALLAVLGVDLIVIVVVLGTVLARRRWVKHQPGVFAGAIRVAGGDIDGLGSSWKRGYGRWVHDVLVWTKAPLNVRNVLLPTEALNEERDAGPDDDLKRLGDRPVLATVTSAGAVVEIAASDQHSELLRGPYLQKEHA
jgi:Protein of unknown function (DUF2550)